MSYSVVEIDSPEYGKIKLEYQLINTAVAEKSPLIFLHEGLGSIRQWHDWPEKLCRRLNAPGLVYSRFGYGSSSARPETKPWGHHYLQQEAEYHLPAILAKLGLESAPVWLFGHSNGATIALLFAALYPDKVYGAIVESPHSFMEPKIKQAIAGIKSKYPDSYLQQRLRHYHNHADDMFYGWCQAWLDPDFENWDIRNTLLKIRCPLLAIQGELDQYASQDQIKAIRQKIPTAQTLLIPECGHVPHQEQPDLIEQHVLGWLKGKY